MNFLRFLCFLGQLEALQATVELLREEIKVCSTQTVEQNQQRNEAIMQQQEELTDMKQEYESVQGKMSTMKESVDEIVELIGKLFKVTDFADSKPVLELLGNFLGEFWQMVHSLEEVVTYMYFFKC